MKFAMTLQGLDRLGFKRTYTTQEYLVETADDVRALAVQAEVVAHDQGIRLEGLKVEVYGTIQFDHDGRPE